MPPHLAFLLTTAISLGRSVRPAAGKVALTIDAIMARVAANQNQSEELQKQYLCKEHIHVVTRKPGGRVMREETADYEIALMGTGTQKQLKALTGRYWHEGKYEDFNGEPVPAAESWDADYIRDLRMCLTEESRCTVAAHLFPLTAAEQNKYEFRLIGQDLLRGRAVYHIGFVPQKCHKLAINIPRRTIWARHSSARDLAPPGSSLVARARTSDPITQASSDRLSRGRCHRLRASDTQIDRLAEPLRPAPAGM